jgi:modified peptide precursor CbpA
VPSAGALCFFDFPEEWIMTQTVPTQQPTQNAAKAQAPTAAPTIAVRKSCNPDGIGLSHYVLMDKKAAK